MTSLNIHVDASKPGFGRRFVAEMQSRFITNDERRKMANLHRELFGCDIEKHNKVELSDDELDKRIIRLGLIQPSHKS